MRATKTAIAAAFRADRAITELVTAASIYAVERATIPTLPSIEVIGISSERVDHALVRHELSIEVTVSHGSEDGADAALDAIVRAVRARLSAAENSVDPIALPSRESVSVVLGESRWSVSASDQANVIRGAAVSVSAAVSE